MKLISFLQDSSKMLEIYQRYIAKSNPYIVMVSTPNAPELQDIDQKDMEMKLLLQT
jgi:hypothetical protein